MEHFGNNNTSGMDGSGNHNMFNTLNFGHHDGMEDYLVQGDQITTFLQHTEPLNLRLGVNSSQSSSTNFIGLRPEQHFSLLSGGSLFVQLNIEGPSGANNIAPAVMETPAAVNNSSQHDCCSSCGRKKRSAEGTSFSIDLNQIPTDLDQELYCECENHPMTNADSSSQTEIGVANSSHATQNQGGSNRGGTPFRIQDIGSMHHGFAQNLIVNPTQLAEIHNQSTAEAFVGNLNQDQFVLPAMPPRFDVNIPPVYEANLVIEISDDENNELENLDDMHLDIDDMTYEELMDLGERIGGVNTGLTEEIITEHLRHRYYRVPNNRTLGDMESCCICLVDFKNRDVLGKISCMHKLHYDCIKQWLKERNCCPMCKRTALPEN